MDVRITLPNAPDLEELKNLLVVAYSHLHPDDAARFSPDQEQSLDDWFSIEDLIDYSQNHGALIEARDSNRKLVGAAYVGKENPLSWPDGHKMKLFFLAVLPQNRGHGIGQALIREAVKTAQNRGAEMLIVDTHVLMEADHRLYKDKAGMTGIGVLKSYYANGDAIFFGMKLSTPSQK